MTRRYSHYGFWLNIIFGKNWGNLPLFGAMAVVDFAKPSELALSVVHCRRQTVSSSVFARVCRLANMFCRSSTTGQFDYMPTSSIHLNFQFKKF
eukprot:1562900-Pyramimonas_sp.AAC.1